MIPPWRKQKPVFRLYFKDNRYVVTALNSIACGYKYRRQAESLGYIFQGFEYPEIKVKYTR